LGTLSDIFLIKYNSAGVLQWVRYFNGIGNGVDKGYALALDSVHSNVYVTGSTMSSSSNEDYIIIKYNDSGVEQWARTYNETGNYTDFGTHVAVDPQGNAYINGMTRIRWNNYECTTIKYDSTGNMQWVNKYSGPANRICQPNSMVTDKNGNVYIVGLTLNDHNQYLCATIKYNTQGQQQWVQLYFEAPDYNDKGSNIALDNQGNIYVAGEGWFNSSIDFLIIKYNQEGVQQWADRYDISKKINTASFIAVNRFNEVFVGGNIRTFADITGDYYDFLTLKYRQPPYVFIPGHIEAENWYRMIGVQAEQTADSGSGQNVGYIDPGDWLDYAVHVPSAGNYVIHFRVAAPHMGARFDIRDEAGMVLTTVEVPYTGGWQNWKTIETTIHLPAGDQVLRLFSTSITWNINWLEFDQAPGYTLIPAKIEAENWYAMSGVQSETTMDAGGGANVGYIDAGDWMEYAIHAPVAGRYTFEFRVAAPHQGASFELRSAAGTLLASLNVPITGGWQNWVSITTSINLPEGDQVLRLTSTSLTWNINSIWINGPWVIPSVVQNSRLPEALSLDTKMNVNPNPFWSTTRLTVDNEQEGKMEVEVVSVSGVVYKQFYFQKTKGTVSFELPLERLISGTYILLIRINGQVQTKKIIKL
jgi:hypothetical protein